MDGIEKIAEVLKKENNFVIGAHVTPDGDSLGSLLALGAFMKQMDKKYCLSSSDAKPQIPPQYEFMVANGEIKEHKQCFKADVFVSLECPSLERLGANYKLAKQAKTLVNIDHHFDNRKYGDVKWLEAEASSTCEMLYALSKLLPVKINKKIAQYLYVGILTDTGRFQYSNVRPNTFETAKELLQFGLNLNEIFKQIYESRSYFSTVMLGEVLAKAKFFPKMGFAYSSITNEDFLLNNINQGETEHFIDFLRAIKGVRIAAIFKEVSAIETKVSLRSTDEFNVSTVAEKFGGGGHKAAAGYISHKPLKDAIKDLYKAIKKQLL